jgi:hypothetical protein
VSGIWATFNESKHWKARAVSLLAPVLESSE